MVPTAYEVETERLKRELLEKQTRRQEEPFLPPLDLVDGEALEEPTLIRMQRAALREHLKALIKRVQAFERVVGRIDHRLVGRAGRDSLRCVAEQASVITRKLGQAEQDIRRDG